MRRGRRRKFKRLKLKLSPKLVWAGFSLAVCFAVLGVLGYMVYTSDTFKIKEGNIQSNVILSKGLKEKIRKSSLFDLDTKLISSYISRKHPEYKEIIISKKFPSSVWVEVKKRVWGGRTSGETLDSIVLFQRANSD